MSPDSSSADPDPIPSSCLSPPSMIQVPECTQSHGGGLSGPGAVIKPHQIQIMDYKKIEPALGDYMPSPPKVHQSIFHQKPAMVPKSEEDLNLGKSSNEGLRIGSIRRFPNVCTQASHLVTGLIR